MNSTAIGNRFGWVVIACAAMLLGGALHARPVTYKLTQSASYAEGCFEMCMCPIWMSPMTGWFRLTPISITGTYDTYSVTNIHWHVSATGDHITGSGTYTVFSEFAALNRMELDLIVNGTESLHVDSGMVTVGASWPKIKVTVAEHGAPACYDTRLNVAAKPVHADVNGDGSVSVQDLLAIVSQWGPCPDGPSECPADIAPEPSGNKHVDVDDLLAVVSNWE